MRGGSGRCRSDDDPIAAATTFGVRSTAVSALTCRRRRPRLACLRRCHYLTRVPMKGFAVQLSFESSEPLADVLSTLETVYGVELTVSGDGLELAASAASPAKRTAAKPAAGRSTVKGAGSQRSRRGQAGKPAAKDALAGRDAGLSQRARAWARENGVEVSGRGRLPASTLEAYAAAQS